MQRLTDIHDAFRSSRVGGFIVSQSGLFGGVAVLLIAAYAYAPLFGGGMILTGDTIHIMRILEMHRCLSDGQVPCRWVPDMGNGYGYPLFNYYPPLPYYAGDLLHRLGLSYLKTVDMLYVIGLAGAGLSMYTLGRRLWGTLGGMVSAIAYVYAPYLALDVYLRGALAELWALAIVPALLWAVLELIATGRPRYVPVIALLLAALLLSHNLVAVIVAPALALWVVVLLLLQGRRLWRPALLGTVAALWGFGLAAFFTLPVLLEGDLVQVDNITLGAFEYTNHFASVSDLFFQRTGDYSYILNRQGGTPLQIGWFHWGLAALAVPAGLAMIWTRRRASGLAVLMLVVFFGVGVFMATSTSKFIWDTFGSLRFLQFPWRYLGLVSIAAAGLAGAWLALLQGRSLLLQLVVAGLLIGVLVGSGRTFFHPPIRFDLTDADLLSGPRYELRQRGAIRDYLPKAVETVPARATTAARVIDGDAQVSNTRAGSDWLEMEVAAGTLAQVEASIYYFEHWRISIDGQPRPPIVSQPHGLIVVAVPPGDHHVELWLENTGVRTLGNRLSLAAWSAMALAVPVWLSAPYLRRFAPKLPGLRRPRYPRREPALSGPEGGSTPPAA
ncbi:MAG: 6-pyruvoyl-tetrahydropterin synthase-related protein [Dehalococcoidia bacterium]